MQITNAGLVFWLPNITSRIPGLSTVQITSLSVVPYALQIIGLFVLGRMSDKFGHRRLHVLAGSLCIALGLSISAVVGPVAGLVALCLSFFGYGTMSTFWSLATSFLNTTAAGAAGLAFVNSVAALGGFVGPTIFGFLLDLTGTDSAALMALSGFAVMAAILIIFVRTPAQANASKHDNETTAAQ